MATKLQKLRVWSTIAGRLVSHPFKLRARLSDFHLLSDRQTLEYLRENRIGIVRFGDGELNFTAGYPAIHQKQDPALRRRLIHILREYNGSKPYLLALPLDLLLTGNYAERHSTPENWRAPRYAALPYLKKGVVYGSPFCFRLGAATTDTNEDRHLEILSLFSSNDIIYIGNDPDPTDAFSAACHIHIPKQDAFADYNDILIKTRQAARTLSNPVVLIAGGVTATALAAELNAENIQAYDMGAFFNQLRSATN